MFWLINTEVARLVTDEGISRALDSGEGMSRGIMQRCIDYDKNYKLKRLGFDKNQRAVGAIYIFSKEVQSPAYENLEKAVRAYAGSIGVNGVFEVVDRCLVRKNGHLYWNP